MHSLDGLWQPVHAQLNGEEAPAMMLEKMEVEITSGRYTVRFGGVAADHGTCELEAAGLTLKGLVGPNAGKTIPCLFEFVENRLVICYGLGGVRPEKFSAEAGEQTYLVMYARKL
jgi:uncharacterized protein (TIGR03067 family)